MFDGVYIWTVISRTTFFFSAVAVETLCGISLTKTRNKYIYIFLSLFLQDSLPPRSMRKRCEMVLLRVVVGLVEYHIKMYVKKEGRKPDKVAG